MPILLIDLDNTISDGTKRTHAAGPEPDRAYPKDHEAWCKKVQSNETLAQDPQVPGMLWLVQRLAGKGGAEVIYCTARTEDYREVTLQWLKKHLFPNGMLVMRKQEDLRSTEDFKESVIKEIKKLSKNKVIYAFDDAPQPDMPLVYKAHGIIHLKPTWCLYTEEGELNALYEKS